VGGLPAAAIPSRADADEAGEAWSEEERRARSETLEPTEPATTPIAAEETTATSQADFTPMALVTPEPAITWPRAITALRPSRPGRPVEAGDTEEGFAVRAERVTAAQGKTSTVGQMRAEVLDQAAARRAGVDGVLMSVTNPTGDAADVGVEVEYPSIAAAYGGDWASRLRLVELPDCALTTPSRPECRVQTPVGSENDVALSTVTATVESSSLGVMALTAGSSGSTGDWSATPLSASASWQVSAQTGAFSWSYPLRIPPAVGGPEPALALSYSAASLDGRVATTNNQTSWVGDGWSLETGYVERKYVSCSDDMAGGNNATRETYDLCWRTDNATLVLNGQALELVRDAATGTWHAKDDDGTKVEHLTGASNGDNDGEYWKVTTVDGTQYFFGRGQRPADNLALNSTWTVPVFGNQAGEPCYASTFASSSCTQAWRWNLEYVVDTSANTMTYVYATETNYYGRNLGTAVSSYVRGGYLTRIEYGQRQGSEKSSAAPARVVFEVTERCIPSGTVTCGPEQLTAATASSWPDVPFDLICTSATSCPTQVSPAFFTRKRLTTVTAQVLSGTTFTNVDRWTLTHTFPSPGDGTGASLWLDTIGHTGLVGGSVTVPDVQFFGTQMANRVDMIGDYGPPMNRYRLTGITTETGATISVNYTPTDCTSGDVPGSPDANTRRCSPVVWDPEGGIGPITEYFHKYLVDSVVANPGGGGLAVETHYDYVGSPAWHYDDSPLTPAEYRTWGDFRGYETVDVITGATTEPVRPRVRYRYFRGMNGDHLASGGTRTVTVDGMTDEDRLNGFLREQLTYDGVNVVTATLTWPWISAPTATGADGTASRFLDSARAETRTALSSGGWRTTRAETTYDGTYGMPTQIDDRGDTATTADDRCTRIEYARNAAANIVGTIKRTETVGVGCASTPTRPQDVVSDTRAAYDGAAYGAAPTRGLVTQTQQVASYTGGTPVYVTESTTTYDAHGRAVSTADALGRTTTTAYTPATGGPATRITTTSPDPDGTGTLTAHVTVTDVNPAWGVPTKTTDANNKVTTATYDALGRITAVWQPGRAQGTKSASMTYEYAISTTGVNAVTTRTLTASEGYVASVAIYDGLLRERQTQSPDLDRRTDGRVVTDSGYDSRGLLTHTNGAWLASGTPTTSLVTPTSAVPSSTRYVYDGAGRTTAEIFEVNGTERWRTTTTYGGDRVTVDPPTGAVPTTTITDAREQTVELRQYTGASPGGAHQSTTYAYDDAGRLSGMTDAAGNTWAYGFDLRGRQVTASDPDKGTTTTTYDDAGQVTAVTDARGETLANVYDSLGRRIQLRDDTTTGTLRASWVYDTLVKGEATSSTRYDGASAYTVAVTGYNDAYQPLGQTVTIPSAEGALAGTYTTRYAYMPNGQPKSVQLPAGGGLTAETVTTYYDRLSVPEWMSGGFPAGVYVAGTRYSSFGELTWADLGGAYAGLMTQEYEFGTHRLARTLLEIEGLAGYALDTTYAYDDAGNPLSITDAPTTGAGDTQCFAYDGMRRLTQAWTPANGECTATPTAAGLGGAAPYWFTDSFDLVGNRASRVTHDAAGDTTATYTYPAAGTPGAHTLTGVTTVGPDGTATNTYTYDATGNTTTRSVDDDPDQTLTWDAESKLTLAEAGGATDTYLYTADGDRLIRRQDGATTLYLPGGEELTRTAAGQVKATRYYTFNGTTIAVRTGTGVAGATTLISDPHGTAQLAFHSSTRAITHKYTDPYGDERGTTPTTWAGDHGYLDKPEDTTGLTQVGARYYDSTIGRFITVDPIMDLADPQQWNGYAYSNNNPITWSDPTGLKPMIDGQWGSSRAAARASTGRYDPGPPAPQNKALLQEFADIAEAGNDQEYVDRADNLTQDEVAALGDNIYTIQGNSTMHAERIAACDLNGGCAPCDTWCQVVGMVLLFAAIAVPELVMVRGLPAIMSRAARADAAAVVNARGRVYPSVLDPRTGRPIAAPPSGLSRVQVADRVSWGGPERGAYIKEWYNRGYSTPQGGWSKYDIHHIVPREYGGTNNFSNLVPVLRPVHQQEFNPWWTNYGE
jgi:RHS repeat-associated protein